MVDQGLDEGDDQATEVASEPDDRAGGGLGGAGEALGDRHRDLPRHRPGEGLPAEPEHAAERDQPRPARRRRPKAGIEQPPGGRRQHYIKEREDLGEPADRVGRDAVLMRRRGVGRREGEPGAATGRAVAVPSGRSARRLG